MEQNFFCPLCLNFLLSFQRHNFSGCVTEKHLSTGWARACDLKITFLAWGILKNSMGDR
jgi:hypothetical protein